MLALLKKRSFWMMFPFLVGWLVASPAWSETRSIGKPNTNVLSGPGLNYKVLYKATQGYPVEILSKQKAWVKVKDWEGVTGWVHSRMLSNVRTAVVLVGRANVRSEPSIDSSVLGKVSQGEIYLVMSQDSDWAQIGYYFEKERLGWIREDLVFGN
jgi:uncharacterized protein YgiM (DUF1202 family)